MSKDEIIKNLKGGFIMKNVMLIKGISFMVASVRVGVLVK